MAQLDFGLLNNNPVQQQQAAAGYAQKIMDMANQRQAGQQYATGDYNGAASTLAQGGNIPAAQQVSSYAQGQAAKTQAYISQALPVFQSVAQAHANDQDHGAAALGAAFDHIASEAQAVTGAQPQQLANFRQQLTADPQGTIARMTAQIAPVDKTVGNSMVQFKGMQPTGAFTSTPTGLVYNNLQGGSAPAPQPQPQAQPQPQPQSQPAQTASLQPQGSATPPSNVPLGIRSNNPGNLMPGGQEATYTSPTAGILAASDNLAAYGKQGVNTISGIVSKWAPPGQNNTQAYIQAVSQRLGIDPNAPLNLSDPNVRGQVLEAIFQQENGQQPALPGQPPSAVPPQAQAPQGQQGPQAQAPQAQAQQAQQPNGQQVITHVPLAWGSLTSDEQKQYPGAIQINHSTGQVKYPPTSAVAAGMTDAQIQPIVDNLKAGGTMPGYLWRNPALLARVFDGAKAEGISMQQILANQGDRKATQTAYQQVNVRYQMTQAQEQSFQQSLNLAQQKVQSLGNDGGGKFILAFKNYLQTGVKGDPATGAAIDAVETAMNEYGKIIEGATGQGGSSVSARNEANGMLAATDNIQAFLAKADVIRQDAAFKLGGLKSQHDSLLGALGSIGENNTPSDGIPVMSPIEAMKAPSGTKFRGTDGVVRVRK